MEYRPWQFREPQNKIPLPSIMNLRNIPWAGAALPAAPRLNIPIIWERCIISRFSESPSQYSLKYYENRRHALP